MASKALPRVAVLGVGSVGGIIAAALESAQRSTVTLVARGECLNQLRSKGLSVKTFEGERFRYDFDGGRRVLAMDDVVTSARKQHQDFLLVATKAHQPLIPGAIPACWAENHDRIVHKRTSFLFHRNLTSTDPGAPRAQHRPEAATRLRRHDLGRRVWHV